jgi:hypothetical protein
MNTKVNATIPISVDVLSDIAGAASRGELMIPVDKIDSFSKLIQAYQDYEELTRLADDPTKWLQWDLIVPKPSRNILRAGNTAYGYAVILSMSPFVLCSRDGKNKWQDAEPANFERVGRIPMDEIIQLNTKFGQYPIIG